MRMVLFIKVKFRSAVLARTLPVKLVTGTRTHESSSKAFFLEETPGCLEYRVQNFIPSFWFLAENAYNTPSFSLRKWQFPENVRGINILLESLVTCVLVTYGSWQGLLRGSWRTGQPPENIWSLLLKTRLYLSAFRYFIKTMSYFNYLQGSYESFILGF